MLATVRNTSLSILLASVVAASAFMGTVVSSGGCKSDVSSSSTGGGGSGGGTGGSGGAGAGGGTGGSVNALCFDYSTFDGTMPTVSFKADVLPIFQRSCGISLSCHGDSSVPNENRPYLGPNQNTVATAEDIIEILGGIVDVSSFFEPGMKIVTPGDPAHSFLMHKLDDTLKCTTLECTALKECGGFMPQGANDPLDQSERDLVRRWIAQGAKND
jgi:hypothetical protein